ncbi:hypothetical protein Dimus_029299 [Dionaea muscipula]
MVWDDAVKDDAFEDDGVEVDVANDDVVDVAPAMEGTPIIDDGLALVHVSDFDIEDFSDPTREYSFGSDSSSNSV